MRSFLLLTLFATMALGFSPAPATKKATSTQLKMERRGMLLTGLAGLVAAPFAAQAKGSSTFVYEDRNEINNEPAQMKQDGKLDLNSAFVKDYMVLPGMYPHAAGMIASHGPYQKVSDIYKIEGVTDNDIKLFKKYEKEFTVNPPGRAFGERINARVST